MINTTIKHALHSAFILCFLSCNHAFAGVYDASASVLRFQTKMAERGVAESQYNLGFMYETGAGAEQNLSDAMHWYSKASAQNYQAASDRLVYLQIKTKGMKNEHAHWLSRLKNSAQSNDKDALFLLGQMYAEGTGVNKSLTLSLELLRKAARKNIPATEPHIIRIEAELAALQQKYATPETNQGIKKLSSNINKVATQKKNTSNHQKKALSAAKIQNKHQPEFLKKAPVIAKLQIKNTASIKHRSASLKSNINTPPETPITAAITPKEADYSHPMDVICNGSNHFMNGCR